MKISIENLDKDALFQKLEHHVILYHQKQQLTEENTKFFFTTITKLSNVFNDPITVEIETQSFNDIYGAGVLEKYVKQQREEQSKEAGAKTAAMECKTAVGSAQTSSNATISISNLDRHELIYKLHIKTSSKAVTAYTKTHNDHYYPAVIMMREIIADPGITKLNIASYDEVFGKGVLQNCVLEQQQRIIAKTKTIQKKKVIESETSTSPVIATAFLASSGMGAGAGSAALESKQNSENDLLTQRVTALKTKLENMLAHYYKDFVKNDFITEPHYSPDTWSKGYKELTKNIDDLEKMLEPLRLLLLLGQSMNNAQYQYMAQKRAEFEAHDQSQSRIAKLLGKLLEVLPKPERDKPKMAGKP